ncbi:DUF4190 domain-containing protein [Bacillus sp. HMF5848]|uniref:DUF4190 domain-containing protein n=1 Tax=Bacillus sp. HMF5848 TaxID=2495421 RepID=UPI00163A5043|nr:DUF4190 domain-containing protein [Bacillus sp. HMF5848]
MLAIDETNKDEITTVSNLSEDTVALDENIDVNATTSQSHNQAPTNDYYEETAAEIAVPVRPDVMSRTSDDNQVQTGRTMGWLALALSIISLFAFPVLMGGAGIVLGFIARRRGATSLGAWSIGLGALSLIISLFLFPFV